MRKLGNLYGADIYVDTEDVNVERSVQKWLEEMDMRYRKLNEEQFKVENRITS